MKKIKSNNTKPEIKLRKALWSSGFRYRLNYQALIGKPDIAFIKQKIAIFIDGDFWHGYKWDEKKDKIKANRDYWIPKIERNIQRDNEINIQLAEIGWTVLRFWEHDIQKDIESCIKKIAFRLTVQNK